MAVVAALLFAVVIAAWTYRPGLDRGAVRLAAIARVLGVFALILLFLDPGLTAQLRPRRPVVLLDNSVSMHAAGGHLDSARALAASLGDTATFGELAPGVPGGRSSLDASLNAAASGARPVIVISDGEIPDLGLVPADVLARASVRLVRRDVGDDVALVGVRAPLRLSAGDTLDVEVELLSTRVSNDTIAVTVRDGDRTLMQGIARFANSSRARLRLAAPLPATLTGERWLEVRRDGPADAEPGDDVRWLRLVVTPTPGVIVIATMADWDARFLFRTLREVVETPVRGYVQIERGRWRRMDDLREVPASDVAAAASRADLLAVRGDTMPWRRAGRSRLLWPPASTPGDWYLAQAGASPVVGAFAGIDPDSLPPASAAGAVGVGADWVGLHARLARRGADVVVVAGRTDSAGRTVIIGVDGLYRWAFRGGVSDQAWRTLLGDATAWLLAAPEPAAGAVRVIDPVTQRGRPVRFRWAAGTPAAATAIVLETDRGSTTDTLRFDGAGLAMLALPVGRYRYRLDGGGTGAFAVEPFSDELVPSPVTLIDHSALGSPPAARRSLRDMLWLFGLAIAGLGSEWMMRRKLGLV